MAHHDACPPVDALAAPLIEHGPVGMVSPRATLSPDEASPLDSPPPPAPRSAMRGKPNVSGWRGKPAGPPPETTIHGTTATSGSRRRTTRTDGRYREPTASG